NQAVADGYEPAAERLRRCKEMMVLRARLPNVLAGSERPRDAAECLAFAVLCQQPFEQRHAAAARLYALAFELEPQLGNQLSTNNRYNAACSACMAGYGLSADAAALDEAAKAKLRGQALGWLRA